MAPALALASAIQTVICSPVRASTRSAGLFSPAARERLLAGGGRVFKAFHTTRSAKILLRRWNCRGSPRFLTMGLACCYASVHEAIKLYDAQAAGLVEPSELLPLPERLKSAHSVHFLLDRGIAHRL